MLLLLHRNGWSVQVAAVRAAELGPASASRTRPATGYDYAAIPDEIALLIRDASAEGTLVE